MAAKLLENYEDLRSRDIAARGKPEDRHALLENIAQRHLELLKIDRTDEAAEMMEVDTQQYMDPALYAREKAAIFDRFPVVAGLSRDISKPGDYIKLDELDSPIFVTRNKEGKVKAFLNGCRHRGTEMVHTERGGGKPLFTCPYHGWSFDLNGALVGVPCGRAFDKLDKKEYSLIELECEERFGIIFVAPKPGVKLDLDHYINDKLAAELDLWGYDTVEHVRTGPIHIKGNWKLALDTFMESYHFAVAHADNLATISNANVNTFDQYDKNMRISVSLKALQADHKTIGFKDMTLENYLTIAYDLFPRTVLINIPQGIQLFRIFPKSIDETVILFSCYSKLPLDEGDNRKTFEMVWQNGYDIIMSDDLPYAVIGAFKAMKAGALPKIVFGKNEQALHVVQKSIHQALAEYNG
jgi:phenylpropionate dioxygenase-like ring-hydroxylating dioxygenase large terminal subunit